MKKTTLIKFGVLFSLVLNTSCSSENDSSDQPEAQQEEEKKVKESIQSAHNEIKQSEEAKEAIANAKELIRRHERGELVEERSELDEITAAATRAGEAAINVIVLQRHADRRPGVRG